jgi:hypothetical protein
LRRLVLLPHVEFDTTALDRRLTAGDHLVPLTVEGSLKAAALGAPILPLRELLPYDEIRALGERAHDLTAALGRPPSGPVRLDGVDWNHLLCDDGALFYARELLFGQALGRALSAARPDAVSWVGAGAYEPHLPLHGLLAALRRESALPIACWSTAARRRHDLLPRLSARARRALRRLRRRPPVAGGCRVAAIFATSEWQRFTNALEALRRTEGAGFEVWYLGPIPKALRAWAASVGVTVRSVAYPDAVEPDVQRFAEVRWRAWRDRDRAELAERFACPALAGDEVGAHFRRLFTLTLPRTVQWGRTVGQMLGRRRPSLLLGSAAFTYLSAFPFHVAAARRVPSLALAHAAAPGDHLPTAATFLGCRNGFEREGFRRAFPDDERVVLARDAGNRLSYEPSPAAPATAGPGRLVAVLTSSPSTEGLVLPMVEIEAFVATLRALAAPPGELSGLRVALKFHPRFDLSPLLGDLFDGSRIELYPAHASVTDLLAEAWAIVVCNHYGSVVAEAAATGKPLVFLDSARFHYPGVETLAVAAGERVESVGELWRLLAELASSPQLYRELAARCRAFRDRLLSPVHTTLAEAIAALTTEPAPVAV